MTEEYEYVRVESFELTPSQLVWRRYKRPAPTILGRFLDANPHIAPALGEGPFLPFGMIVRIPIDLARVGREATPRAHRQLCRRSGYCLMAIGARPTRFEAHCEINVDGKDVTKKWDPRLISITITDPEEANNEAQIELDDSQSGSYSGGVQSGWFGPLPRLGSPLILRLGWLTENSYRVFNGWVWDIESSNQRKSGRRLQIIGQSAMSSGKVRRDSYWGDGAQKPTGGSEPTEGAGITLGTVLKDAGKAAGYGEVTIHPALASITRPYWIQTRESAHQFMWRLARENGGIFKVDGKVVGVGEKDGFTNAFGEALPTIAATVGQNVIAWRIKPFVTRPAYSEARAAHTSLSTGLTKFAQAAIKGDAAGTFQGMDEAFTQLWTRAAEGEAKQDADSQGQESTRAQAQGWIVIQGEPQAISQCKIVLTGARPGVNGTYKAKQVEHQYSRQSGFITRIDVIEPDLNFGPNPPTYWPKTETSA